VSEHRHLNISLNYHNALKNVPTYTCAKGSFNFASPSAREIPLGSIHTCCETRVSTSTIMRPLHGHTYSTYRYAVIMGARRIVSMEGLRFSFLLPFPRLPPDTHTSQIPGAKRHPLSMPAGAQWQNDGTPYDG
jgi:hypothetical protein